MLGSGSVGRDRAAHVVVGYPRSHRYRSLLVESRCSARRRPQSSWSSGTPEALFSGVHSYRIAGTVSTAIFLSPCCQQGCSARRSSVAVAVRMLSNVPRLRRVACLTSHLTMGPIGRCCERLLLDVSAMAPISATARLCRICSPSGSVTLAVTAIPTRGRVFDRVTVPSPRASLVTETFSSSVPM